MAGTRDIVIIGAGIGGLALAAALARAGHSVEVLERAARIEEVGAGLQITPNGHRVIEALGLAEKLATLSVASRAVSLRDYRKGREVFRHPLTRHEGRYRLVHRADLIALLEAAARVAGAEITLGAEVTRVIPGTPPRLEGQGVARSPDLIVGADGVRSIVRPVLNGISRPAFSGQVAWRAIQPNLDGHPPEARVHMGPGRHMVSYPVRDGHILNIVGVEERADWAEEGWSHRDDPANLLRAFKDFAPEVRRMLGGVSDVGLWGLFRHPVARVWGQGNVALLGDAAHPTVPFLAQGANMALEDAWTLAALLDRHADTDAALGRYRDLRHDRCARIVAAAEANARAWHLSSPPLRFGMQTALRLAGAIRPELITSRFDWVHDHDPVTAAGT